MRHVRQFPNLTYLPQDYSSLQLMLWGRPRAGVDPGHAMPFHPAHPVFRRDLARFFVDPKPWIDYLSTVDFAFGDRIHGNIAAILAGTPALLLAHDSRTLELARYHSIPHVVIGDLGPDMDAVDFYEMTDFTAFNDGQPARWEKFEGYLSRHGLAHAFDEPGQVERYDAKVAAADFPPPVRPITRDPSTTDLDRVDWLYREVGRAPSDLARLTKAVDAQGQRIARLEAQVDKLRSRGRTGRTLRRARTAAKKALDRRRG